MKNMVFLVVALVSFVLMAIAVGVAVPALEVKLDRFGNCTYVTDLRNSEQHECGYEAGRRYTTSY